MKKTIVSALAVLVALTATACGPMPDTTADSDTAAHAPATNTVAQAIEDSSNGADTDAPPKRHVQDIETFTPQQFGTAFDKYSSQDPLQLRYVLLPDGQYVLCIRDWDKKGYAGGLAMSCDWDNKVPADGIIPMPTNNAGTPDSAKTTDATEATEPTDAPAQ